MATIYIVEDDVNIREIERYALKNSGYEVEEFESGESLFKRLERAVPSLLLLDIMLPDEDGLEILGKLRANKNTAAIPVIMVTAKTSELDKVKGLDLGADDYITKPFNPIEVSARVKSQLRRYMQLGGGTVRPDVIRVGGIELDDKEKRVMLDGELVALTPTEYEILKLLIQNPGQVFSPKEIYTRIWNDLPLGSENTVAVHIRHLREKLEINPAEPRYLKVVWGQGYKCEKHG